MFTKQHQLDYTINGRRAKIQQRETSDLDLYPHGRYAKSVQLRLDTLSKTGETWRKGDIPVVHGTGNKRIMPAIVEIAPDDKIFWALHIGYGPAAGFSPFVYDREIRDDERGKFTIELAGTSERPQIYRLYRGGIYMMPMPYTRRARRVKGGVKKCIEFWMTHAHLWNEETDLFVPGTDCNNYHPGWMNWYPDLYERYSYRFS